MTVILILIALLAIGALVALALGYVRNRKIQHQIDKGELTEFPSIKQIQDMECCGQHETCERDSLLAAVSKQIEYYNDEELDRFQGRSSDAYTTEEIDEFREILYTMQEVEVAGWVRSLQLRAVELPDELKDEVFLIVGERRMGG